MTHERMPASADLLTVPDLVESFWEIGRVVQFAFWNMMTSPFRPSPHNHMDAHPEGQLAIPEPIAQEDEHGLFA